MGLRFSLTPYFRSDFMATEATKNEILKNIDEKELKDLVLDLVNIPSPTGSELNMGLFVSNKLKQMGMDVIWQEVEEGRPNVIGILRGNGTGPTLEFDGHLDVSFSGNEDFMMGGASAPSGSVKKINGEDWIFGVGSFNMKAALAAYIVAAKAIIKSGHKLKGDLVISATCGEIEETQVDEFSGKQYRGYGSGARYATSHGILPDYAILGEPTGLKIMLGHFGSFWVKLTATGGTVVHTAWSRNVPNKIEQFTKVIEGVKAWKKSFEERTQFKGYNGIVNISAIKGGRPWKGSRTPDSVSLYLDIRYPPDWPTIKVKREIDSLVMDLNSKNPELKLVSEPYSVNPPTEISEDEEVVLSIKQWHKEITGSEPEKTYELWYSNAPSFNSLGAKAVNYGPSGLKRLEGLTLSDKDREYINFGDLLDCTKVYSMIILDICNRDRK